MKKKMLLIARYGIAIFLLGWLFKKIEIHNVILAVKVADKSLILCAVCTALLFRMAVYPHLWYMVLKKTGIAVRYINLVLLYAASLPFKFIMPFKTSEVTRVAGLTFVEGVDIPRAISSIAFLKFISIGGMLVLAGVGGMVTGKIAYKAVFIASVVIYGCIFIFFKKFQNLLMKIFKKNNRTIEKLFACFQAMRSTDKFLLALYAIIPLIGEIMTEFIIFSALGLDVHFIKLFFILPVIMFASSLPISIHGIGIRESLSMGLLSSYGSQYEIFLGALLISVVYYIVPAILGVPAFFYYSRKNIRFHMKNKG
ncbi:MAG: lysylphosphatidylglycerol synthase transmembrane domain-containing protein [bacterium]